MVRGLDNNLNVSYRDSSRIIHTPKIVLGKITDPYHPKFDWSKVPVTKGKSYFDRSTYDTIQRMEKYNPNLKPSSALELLLDSGFLIYGPKAKLGYDDNQKQPPSYLVGPVQGWSYHENMFSKYIAHLSQEKGVTNVHLYDRKAKDRNVGYRFKVFETAGKMPKNTDYKKAFIPKPQIIRLKLGKPRFMRA